MKVEDVKDGQVITENKGCRAYLKVDEHYWFDLTKDQIVNDIEGDISEYDLWMVAGAQVKMVTLKYGPLKPGQFFRFGKKIFMKLTPSRAFDTSNGLIHNDFSDGISVEPCNWGSLNLEETE